MLDCLHDCDVACQGYLLTYDTQHHLQHLDRHKVLALLSDQFMRSLCLPMELHAFGPVSQLEMEPLVLALNREGQKCAVTELRVYLGGNPCDWKPLAWRLREELLRWLQTGAAIHLIAPSTILAKLETSQRDELVALIAYTGAKLYLSPAVITVDGQLPLLLELGNDTQRLRWAAAQVDALVPCPSWGSGEQGGPFVRITELLPLALMPGTWQLVSPTDLRHDLCC